VAIVLKSFLSIMKINMTCLHRTEALLSLLFLSSLFFASGCALPKIIILNDPLSAEEHAELGRIYESQGKEDLALLQYRAAVRRNPRQVQAWLLLGDLAYRRGDYGEAETAYKKALNLQPESGDTGNNLAWTYLMQNKRTSKAEKLVREAMTFTPEHKPYYLDTLGVVLLRLGKVQESIAALKESVATLPEDRSGFLAEAYGHLAEAYKTAGDAVLAEEAAAMARKYAILM
jgi:tetratricopeptide (TPR) repeat protein